MRLLIYTAVNIFDLFCKLYLEHELPVALSYFSFRLVSIQLKESHSLNHNLRINRGKSFDDQILTFDIFSKNYLVCSLVKAKTESIGNI